MSFEKLSNEQLINLTVETAHRVSVLSESNYLAELRAELFTRLTKRAFDVANAWRCQCGFLVDGNLQTCDVCDTPRK